MKVYITRQNGVYWHEIMHVSTDRQNAIESCKSMAAVDCDSYHDWIVSEFDTSLPAMMEINSSINYSTTDNGYEIEIYRTNKDKELGR